MLYEASELLTQGIDFEAVAAFVDTKTFAEDKGATADQVRSACRTKGDDGLVCYKLWSKVVVDPFNKQNIAWEPSEGTGRSHREDGRAKFAIYLNRDDGELEQVQSILHDLGLPDDVLVDSRAPQAKAKKVAAPVVAVEGTDEDDDEDPFAAFGA